MKILRTEHYYRKSKDKTKEDIVDIGRVLEIFENDFVIATNNGVLCTWTKSYDDDRVIDDIDRIAQVLRIIQGEFHPPWRKA